MITSTANPTIKYIRKLRDRKERQATKLFYIEGLRIVTEAVQQKAKIEQVIVAPELLTSKIGQQIHETISQANIPVVEVSKSVFEALSLKEGPQGIGAVVQQQWTDLEDCLPKNADLWVALESVADPGNLGTILRTLDSVGGRGVILLDQSTDPHDPASMRASMGAVFTQKIIHTGFDAFRKWKSTINIPLIGTAGSASQDYHTMDYPSPLVLLMGSERQGLSEHYQNLCDQIVQIPMTGRSDSLNLAIATAVVLYEIFNHRRDSVKELL